MAGLQRLVAYERVSTARQGLSGLGLEAQRKTIDDFAVSRGADVLGRFTEVESGRKADRPELAKVLHLAKVTATTLVIAKLDRLSRNAAFLLALRDSGVRFVAVDMSEANDLTVGIMALVAQAEREAISRRTKEVLAVAKARGMKLGNPNGAASLRRAAAIRQAFEQPDRTHATETWHRVADQVRPRWPKLADLMDNSEHDVLAYMAFPRQHRTKLHSTNPIERLDKEVKRRADVVGIFPNEASIMRLIGAMLFEHNDEWQTSSRYMMVEAFAQIDKEEIDPLLSITTKAA